MEFDYVIYHNNCIDGFTSLFCLYYANKLKNAKLYGAHPASSFIPQGIKNKNIVIVDVGYSKQIMEKIVKLAKNVVYIDHHITHIDKIKEIKSIKLTIVYDVNHSACVLTWKYCFSSKPPYLFELIEDNDIGNWKIEDTKPFLCAFRTINDFTNVSSKNLNLYKKYLDDKELKKIINIGKIYFEYHSYLMKQIMYKYSVQTFIFGKKKYRIIILNTDTVLGKDAITNLCTLDEIDFAMLWHYDHDKKIFVVILRSNKINVSDIAKHYGGGGHMYAAAFVTEIFPPDLIAKKIEK